MPSRSVDGDPARDDLAAALAAIAAAAARGPEALAGAMKALASDARARDATGDLALLENPIAIDGDAVGVSNPKGHDAMKVFGPYQHRDRWRILIRQGNAQRARSFGSETEAKAEIRRLRAEAHKQAGITVQRSIDAYAEQLRRNGLKERSITTAIFRLTRFFHPVLPEPLATLSPKRAKDLYQSLSGLAVDTRLNMLALAKSFCRKAKELDWTETLLLVDVKGEGRRRCGKAKLTLDESRKYLATCLVQATSSDPMVRQAAIAACMPLVFGLRSGEVLNRQAKDIDDNGRILRITSAKSRAGIRSLQVPDWFRPHLLDLAKSLKPEERIFPREKTWLHRHVVSICKLAGVSRVVPHGLRGTHGDLALVAAATPLQVSQALGHESVTTTFRHYASPQLAEANAHRAAVAQLAPTSRN